MPKLGQAIIFTPLLLRLRLFRISHPTFISSTGSDARDILMVSPIPSDNNIPTPIEDFTVPPRGGTVKSSIGVGMLLSEGIGDTIRISLASDPVDEIKVGWDILKSLNLRSRGVKIIACPSLGKQLFLRLYF